MPTIPQSPKSDRREFLLISAVAVAAAATGAHPARARSQHGALTAISAMTIAPDGRLIVADWRQGALFVLAPPEGKPGTAGPLNLIGINAALSAAGALPRASAMVWDAPRNRALVAVATGAGADAPMAIATITADGQVTLHDPSALVMERLLLADRPSGGTLWRSNPIATLTVTDLVLRDTELLVAGLSNADFSATLRRVPWPFDSRSSAAITRIEMYHAVHNQIETRAPVRAMAVVPLKGTEHLLAAYTCTPLVTAPLESLRNGTSVRAKTIAELGYGNTPVKIVPFRLTARDGTRSDWVLVANAAKAADLIPLADIEAANNGPGLSKPVSPPYAPVAGLTPLQVPLTGAIAVADQSADHLVALRREATSGELNLVSIRKGAFFRLSDHVNEYDVPGYEYPANDQFQQGYVRPFHRLLRTEEGFPDLVR